MGSLELEAGIAFVVATLSGAVLVLWLVDLLRTGDAGQQKTGSRWSLDPATLSGTSYRTLALASVLGLFLELLLIRWITSEVPLFAYFKNVILIACYLGFGLGALVSSRRIFPWLTLAPLLYLCALIQTPWVELRHLLAYLPVYFGVFSEIQIWDMPVVELNGATLVNLAAAMALVAPVMALVALSMAPFGQVIGGQLEAARNGVRAYTVNIAGSLAGILGFTLLCFFEAPPLVWLAVFAVLAAVLVWRQRRLRWPVMAGLAACLALLAIRTAPEAEVFWSPYQKLSLRTVEERGEVLRYHLETNGATFQHIIHQSPGFLAQHRRLAVDQERELASYDMPYRFQPRPRSVLVLGAGMGNDVAAALLHGAERVVAVEIDPLILRLGRERHFEHPYDSPRVEVVNDDARAYLQRAEDRFDLIVFGLLDSHTTMSHFTNVRIDNYVYTVEALTAARRLLAPTGVFTVKFWVAAPWIAGRLERLLGQVFGERPLHLAWEPTQGSGWQIFAGGARQTIARALAEPSFAAWVADHRATATAAARPTTDDWPYFYQRDPGVPASVLLLAAVLVALLLGGLKRAGLKPSTMSWSLFFLGAGFLLIEVQVVSRAALLFGTTWLVNSIVIAGVLVFIVGANVVAEIRMPQPLFAYLGLALSLLLCWALPTRSLYLEGFWPRVALAAGVLCLPVFFAGLVFIQAFAAERFAGAALGSNLLGALAGGLLESLSLWTGTRALVLVALGLYALAFLLRPARGLAQATEVKVPDLVESSATS